MATKTKKKSAVAEGPIHKTRLGSVHLAIWANEHTTEDGETRTFHTIQIERNYKDRDDEWQKTTQLREGDIGNAVALLQGAQDFLMETV